VTDSTAVERAAEAQVPALVQTPALEIGAGDVALPRLYIGQSMSEPVQDGAVEVGQLFTALGQDDPEPQVVSDKGEDADGVLVHVLGMTRKKSLSKDGELELYDYDDPNAPPEAWVTYNYVVALPEVDPDLPFKLLYTRSATSAAKWINAFRIKTAFRSNEKGRWYVPRVSVVEADPANVEIAEKLASLVGNQDTEFQSSGDEPAI
jgi:hypothetical protein